MPGEGDIRINDELSIPRSELTYRATRSGGPGGQHVNTSSTKVELSWSVAESAALSDAQRARITEKLARRIGADGVLRLVASGSRSQSRNKEEATARFAALLAEALEPPKPRRKTRPPRAAKERRLREKKKRGETKRRRRPPEESE